MPCVVGDRVLSHNDEEGVMEKFGVSPLSIPDYLALVGDSTDGAGHRRVGDQIGGDGGWPATEKRLDFPTWPAASVSPRCTWPVGWLQSGGWWFFLRGCSGVMPSW